MKLYIYYKVVARNKNNNLETIAEGDLIFNAPLTEESIIQIKKLVAKQICNGTNIKAKDIAIEFPEEGFQKKPVNIFLLNIVPFK